MGAEKKLAEVLGEVFRRGGMKRPLKRAQLVIMWPRVAGPELSRFTEASGFRDGVLFVTTTDSETAMHLGLQRNRFVAAFHEFGHRELRDIRFRPGRVPPPAAEPRSLPAVPDDSELQPLRRSLEGLDLSVDLQEAAERAAVGIATGRTRRRSLGWRPCLVCGELCESGKLCVTCQRYAGEHVVVSSVQRLVQQPQMETPWLTEAQRQVATWLAGQRLEELMNSLLPQVISDPRLRPQLEHLAGNWLRLAAAPGAGKAGAPERHRLPERVARVLGQT